jgi:uncharacterized protein (DUF1330 family)
MKYYASASYRIKDFKQFMGEFEAAQAMLGKWGFKRTFLNRDADDANHLIVVHECEDLQKARNFYNSQEFRQCIAKAGVIGDPEVTLMEELSRTPQLVSV